VNQFTPRELDPELWWQPEDKYSTRPPCQKDEHGRYFVEFSGNEDEHGFYHFEGVMIDTRIPLRDRKQMSLGIKPVLSYRQWVFANKRGEQ